jgi:hypothetical protein
MWTAMGFVIWSNKQVAKIQRHAITIHPQQRQVIVHMRPLATSVMAFAL